MHEMAKDTDSLCIRHIFVFLDKLLPSDKNPFSFGFMVEIMESETSQNVLDPFL